jgi:hypothetical protein
MRTREKRHQLAYILLVVLLSACSSPEIFYPSEIFTSNGQTFEVLTEDGEYKSRRIYSSKGVLLMVEGYTSSSSMILSNCDRFSFGEHLYSEHFKPFFKSPCDFYKELSKHQEGSQSLILQEYRGIDFLSSLTERDWECLKEYCIYVGCED